MVAMYTIAGRQVGSHVLAMATLGVTFSTAAFFMSGGKKEDGPPIGAGSKEEESFVKDFISKASDKAKKATGA
ncbi:hypothetical protein FKW77_004160 [Venturia effusa]|uniref:Uncharacterized protein n=1 Tax=Venturia effusa TaxID=50376 RepID=A0A517L153_9PEZI|nr:hypothetical protein FKW77_004160 [Venturia effusa]